jgi:hypothetical protein
MDTVRLEPMAQLDYAVAELRGKKNYEWLRKLSQAVHKVSLPETSLHLYEEYGDIKLAKLTPNWRECIMSVSPGQPGADSLLMKTLCNELKQNRCVVVSAALEDRLRQYFPHARMQKLFQFKL